MHALVNIALRAARDAAELIARNIERLDRVKVLDDQEGTTTMERDADRSIIYHLQKAYPDYSIDSRHSGLINGRDSANVWLVDALNGSANANRGYLHFCVSIALQTAGRVSHAVLVDPLTQEEYTASRGGGAQLNATRLRGSKSATLDNGFVSLDAGAGTPEAHEVLLNLQRKLLAANAHIRVGGSPALDMAYVAAGKLDAGWTCEMDPRALAASLLVLQESGALISDQNGNPQTSGSHELLFGNAKCFKQLLQMRQTL